MNNLKSVIILWMANARPVSPPWNRQTIDTMEEMIEEGYITKATHPDGVVCYMLTQKATELINGS